MLDLICENRQFFHVPQKVKVGDKTYENIASMTTREMKAADGKLKGFAELTGTESMFASFLENGKVVRSEERYNTPQTLTLGRKVYNNVVSKITIPEKYNLYTIIKPSGYINYVRERRNGAVVDYAELNKAIIKRKMLKPVKSVVKSLSGILSKIV